jgi:hypothetical protein
MKDTISCPGCHRELSAEVNLEVNGAPMLMRMYTAHCPDHGDLRQPELIERAISIAIRD